MKRRTSHIPWAATWGALAWLQVSAARANGRFPAADQLVINPTDPAHLVIRTTFGFIESRDSGATWQWTCEEIVGRIGADDPPLAVTADGTMVVAVPFEGLAVSHDHGCSWTRAPASLANQLVVDLTSDPDDPATLLALSSTYDADAGVDGRSEFNNWVMQTKDNGRTWGLLGTPLPRDFIASTIEVARSDPNRIYVSGVVGDAFSGAIERSEDRGQTWIRTELSLPSGFAGIFISAIDPLHADRLWLRVASKVDGMSGNAPTTLRVSNDKGATWADVATTQGSMLGFALSPDATLLAYGGEKDGIFIGPADGSARFERVSQLTNRSLTWTAAGLYACGTEPVDTFALGLTNDLGKSFIPLYQLRRTCPQTCPAESRFNTVCRASWTDALSGVAARIQANGQTCSATWARSALPDSGSGGQGGGMGTADVGTPGPVTQNQENCSCRVGGRAGATGRAALLGGLVFLGRRRKKLAH